MKILIIGSKERYEKFYPALELVRTAEKVFCPRGAADDAILAAGGGAQILFADAISPVSRRLIEGLPALKLIHSEGVAFNGIDLEAAREHGIFVCNNKGCNAGAVAEQAILLMLALLRSAVVGDHAVRTGGQMAMKERLMLEGITELSDCRVGLVGFGDIAKATALRLAPFGCSLFYYSLHRKDTETERKYGVSYLPLAELAASCDIVSLHAAVTPESRQMANAALFARMKPTAYLVNTARGELVDNDALCAALRENRIAGAGLDTLAPEPNMVDNPVIALPEGIRDKVIFAPHLGGITTSTFLRAHRHMWENAQRILANERPDCIVNGL